MKKKTYTWIAYFAYVLLLGYAVFHHELWGDELHTWNIVKGSGSYSDMLANRRYEGHPPAWHTVLWVISRFTHQVVYMQVAQWVIACGVAFLVLFRSPLKFSTRLLLLPGYYFLFEYGVLSRNYALGVLFVCWLCIIIRKDFRYKTPLYYALLFCLSNVHLLALLLAASFHGYFLLLEAERKKGAKVLLAHVLGGILVFLPAVCFIAQPADSGMNTSALLHDWDIHRLLTCYEVPLRAFLPIPAWWNYHFWNTQFLIALQQGWLNVSLVLAILLLVIFILRKDKKCVALFSVNLLLNLVVSVTFYALTTARYTGFVYIGFFAAYWLYCYEIPSGGRSWKWVNALLLIQAAGGVFAVCQDIRLSFSNNYQVNTLIGEVPPGEKWVTDFWTINTVVAYTDRPAYCVDIQKERSFILWGPDISALEKMHHRYSTGLEQFFAVHGVQQVYLVTQAPMTMLTQADSLLPVDYRVVLVDKREGAIEKGSNLYLYRISTPSSGASSPGTPSPGAPLK